MKDDDMKDDDEKIEIIFSKEALAALENEPNAQELIDEIEKAVADGSFFEDSEPVDLEKMQEEEPEEYLRLLKAFQEYEEKEEKLN